LFLCGKQAKAEDLTQGLMVAVPTLEGKAPTIDGLLEDWDLSAAEPMWITPQTADRFHGKVALMYDDKALYFSAQVSLPGRPLVNRNNPVDPFWNGDMLELRLVTDPDVAWPVRADAENVKTNRRVVHCSVWRNSETGKDYLSLVYGVRLNLGKSVNPEGSQVVIRTDADRGYVAEVRIPWSALNVPGGRNPFPPGQRMTATTAIHWGGETQVSASYRVNPGSFAFRRPESWGQVEFSATGNIKPRHVSMEEALASKTKKPTGVPIEIDVPENDLKVSVNIFGEHNEVLRELIGGEPHPRGKFTVYWDGRDQWGAPLKPGNYRWGAYLSPGLKAQYVATVGTSGNPGHETEDGRGLWGGDHGAAVAVAADSSGLYFLWTVAESGRAVVKTDYEGKVLWRKTPFVGGGFGPFYAVAANGKYVFVAHESDDWQHLARLDATTGQLLTFPGGGSMAWVAQGKLVKVPEDTTPILTHRRTPPVTSGMAASDREVFMPHYSENTIHVLDPETARILRELPCSGPRGVALDTKGNLYAVSFPENGPARVLKFAGAKGDPMPVIASGLVAPWGVGVDAQGNLHVTDLGSSQQVKTFSPEGKLLRTLGKVGGRSWAGAYDPSSFLLPAGIAADTQGGILVAEASLPKVMSRFDAASGKLLNRWFGAIAYAGLNVPDPLDPTVQYYPVTPDGEHRRALGGSICRASIPFVAPDAYWYLARAGIQDVDDMTSHYGAPVLFMGNNGQKYMFGEGGHGIVRVEGSKLIPVGHVAAKSGAVELWSDRNGDGQLQPEEVQLLHEVDGQRLLGRPASCPGSMWMQPNGDVYLVMSANNILKIPAAGFTSDGGIRWDADKARYAVPVVLPNLPKFRGGWNWRAGPRSGMLGVRIDSKKNLYVCFNAKVPYATEQLTVAMHEGLGHTSGSTAVKIAKFAPDGRLLWMAGRKATAAAKPGEMYHFWVMGGLVGDKYIAGASEWGQIYFYTEDGFFVDALMNNPGLSPPAGPYTFGSETFGGRVQEFPKRNEVWAFSRGMSYKVLGFDHGKVIGERRLRGQVVLDRVYEESVTASSTKPPSLVAVPLSNDPLHDENVWSKVPRSVVKSGDKDLATVQMGYDARNLYVRFSVTDDSPLKNGADSMNMVFHGGDAVGVYLGSANRKNEKTLPGDVRLLAAMIGGKPRLVAMKPVTRFAKHPDRYFTPAGGEAKFEFVGEVPQGQVVLTGDPDGQGYSALLAVPRAFLEVPLQTGTAVAADVEVLLSGQAARGLQTVSRHYLFSPRNEKTNMIDDVPTEARLYPQYWGVLEIQK